MKIFPLFSSYAVLLVVHKKTFLTLDSVGAPTVSKRKKTLKTFMLLW